MCGIAGIVERDADPASVAIVRRMLERLAHRGPDGEHVVADPGPGFRSVLGHRRLTITELSDRGRQPMERGGERWWIAFNGAIYNAIEIRTELETLGERFATAGDTEVLLAAWIRWGRAALPRLNGMWSFAVWDRVERTLVCVRDRYGVKPFYYTTDRDGRFAFASEPKALRSFAPAEPNDEWVRRYLKSGTTSPGLTSRTIYANYRVLPEGSLLTVSERGLAEERWYEPPAPDLPPRNGDPREAAEELRRLLADAVRVRLRADVPVGVFVSGGMDSSSLAALACQVEGPDSAAFTRKAICLEHAGFPEIDESAYARSVLRRIGCEGIFVTPTIQGLEDEVDDLVEIADDLIVYHGFYSLLLLCRAVRREGIKVVLIGQGSDEQLGGYEPWDAYLRSLWRAGRRATAAAEAFLSGRRLWGTARSLRRIRSRLKAAAGDGAIDGLCGSDATLRGHVRHQLLHDYLPVLLRKDDRITMSQGIEARTPFLDYRVVEFTLSLPEDWLLRGGWTKWILREAMKNDLPREIIRRPAKLGMPGPARNFSAGAYARAREAWRAFANRGWVDGAEPSEAELRDAPDVAQRLIFADAWAKRCLGGEHPSPPL